MSHPEKTHEAARLPSAALTELIERIENEERILSKQRHLLHARIDSLQVRSGDTSEFAVELLASLQREERVLSDRRLHLHQQITELRLEQSRRLASSESHPSTAE
jgi:hypothetical protein